MDIAVPLTEPRTTVEALYRADAPKLWRAVYAWSGDLDIASEAVAEAYAQVVARGDAVRDPAAWTWRTAFRIAGGALKARRADREVNVEMPEPGASEPAAHDRYADTDLRSALRQLPDGQRAAVVLFYFADLPIRDIADRLGSSNLAVRANLSRGRRRLRDLLGDDDG